MFPEAATFLDRLRTHLQLDDGVEHEIVREMRAHVEDRVDRLVSQGVREDAARRMVIGGLGRPQTFAHLMRQAHLVTPWREALFGAAPLLLMGAVIGARVWQQPPVAAASFALVVAVTLYGLSLGRPVWFYPWAGVALSLPLVVGYIAFAVLHREIPAFAAGHAAALSVLGVAGAALYFPAGMVVVATAVLVAVRRDWLDASVLLSPLPGTFVWVVALHRAGGLRSPDASLAGTSDLLGIVYVCMALAMVAFLRARSRATKVATMLAAAVLLVWIGTPLDSQEALLTLAVRALLLATFLLSPALLLRRSPAR